MSQTVKCNSVKIRSINCLNKAVARLKAKGKQVELVENATARMWGDKVVFGRFVLKLHGRFDVALEEKTDAQGKYYVPAFDDWNGEVHKQLGTEIAGIHHGSTHVESKGKFTAEELILSNIAGFMTEYSTEAILEEAGFGEYLIESETVENKLVCITLNTD